jgi:hypothetical protein
MRSHVKKFKNLKKNPKYSNFLKKFLFFIAVSYLLLKSKITSFLVGFYFFLVKTDPTTHETCSSRKALRVQDLQNKIRKFSSFMGTYFQSPWLHAL